MRTIIDERVMHGGEQRGGAPESAARQTVGPLPLSV
jgi:hypothetical protein